MTCWTSAWTSMVCRRMSRRAHCRSKMPRLLRRSATMTPLFSPCFAVLLRSCKWTDPLLCLLRSRRDLRVFGNMLAFQLRTFVGAQSGHVSSLPRSVSAGTQTAFQTILRFLGRMASMIAVMPLGLLKMRAFQRWTLSHRLCASDQEAAGNRVLHASSLSLEGAWAAASGLSDASLRGRGALCESASVRGIWSETKRELHINHLKLLAVFLALKHFRPVLEGQHVLVRTDNSTVVSYINRQGGARSLPLLKLSCSLLLWCSVGPDLLSRGGSSGERMEVTPFNSGSDSGTIWQEANRSFCFQGKYSLPPVLLHNRPQWSIMETIVGLDALAHQWPDVLLYAFPPVEMISPVLERVRRHSLSL
ncbi:uncharacterized protein LOC120716967 [Simochromis diagramma]|uniref:uncharacterized protein LOC120716967 n=1 Tax=Simochromis diagramma TaxID=43689 RepID=UPI001A7ED82A|nr:uncharacterized protein LOC120716967 [Simochromis diagramma]